MYAAILCSGNNTKPCDWLTSELPHLLDEICAMAASVQLNYRAGDSGIEAAVERDGGEPEPSVANVTGGGVKLSRAEAKRAWLAAGGDTDRAVRQLLRDRQVKVGRTESDVKKKVNVLFSEKRFHILFYSSGKKIRWHYFFFSTFSQSSYKFLTPWKKMF